jgi:hypothetical protein
MPMTLSKSGRIALAEVLFARQLVLAVGAGDAAWGQSPPPLNGSETALVAPLALVRARSKHYLSPATGQAPPASVPATTVPLELVNEFGELEMSDGTVWVVSPVPTEHLYAVFVLGLHDGPTETLAEIAVHVDPVIDPSVPPGRSYIAWADLSQQGQGPGRFFGGRRFAPNPRAGRHQIFGEMITL